jgi:hypothetical protein
MAMGCHLYWYADVKLASTAVATNHRPGLPLLAYALSFDLWAVQDMTGQKIFTLLKKLLEYRANPNEPYRGSTIWQYTIHYVHIRCSIGAIS